MAEKDRRQPTPSVEPEYQQPVKESLSTPWSVIQNRLKPRPPHEPPSGHFILVEDREKHIEAHKIGLLMQRGFEIKNELKACAWVDAIEYSKTIKAFNSYINQLRQELEPTFIEGEKTMEMSALKRMLTREAFEAYLNRSSLQLKEYIAYENVRSTIIKGKALDKVKNEIKSLETELDLYESARDFLARTSEYSEDYSI